MHIFLASLRYYIQPSISSGERVRSSPCVFGDQSRGKDGGVLPVQEWRGHVLSACLGALHLRRRGEAPNHGDKPPRRHGHGRTRGRGPREGIAISDAQTGEEYTDDMALVLRNSTVVVRRVAGPPADAIVSPSTQRPKATQDGGGSSSDSSSRSSSSVSAAEADDEAKAISAVIDAAELKWEGPSPYNHRGAAYPGWAAPHAGYVCRRCRVPGHFIQHCPTNGDPRFDFGKATSVISPAPAAPVDDDGVPADLHCKICSKVMVDAVVTSKCCFSSFCERCIMLNI
ncbi:hypothetical protein QYE76_024409 [Lolium multiflorum]|uniref:DWNN domain-containing protein n=1 Tax=Lolium multiflorum TaxID=4521 RepID=A0AAD8RD96_LOLMU|nr:hypothetical protein QYE76_024409 [Lolium multiflorum]